MLTPWRSSCEDVSKDTALWQEEAVIRHPTLSASSVPQVTCHSLPLLLPLCRPSDWGDRKMASDSFRPLGNWPPQKLKNLHWAQSGSGLLYSHFHLPPVTLICSKAPVSGASAAVQYRKWVGLSSRSPVWGALLTWLGERDDVPFPYLTGGSSFLPGNSIPKSPPNSTSPFYAGWQWESDEKTVGRANWSWPLWHVCGSPLGSM